MWWGAIKASNGFQSHYLLDELHKAHGDFVRIGLRTPPLFGFRIILADTREGPKEISINNEAAVPVLARCAKGPWYDLAWPRFGLHATRNSETHRVRRRVWDKAFTKDALADYVPRILAHSDELIEAFRKSGKVNVTDYFGYYMFDGLSRVRERQRFGAGLQCVG
jgi:tryprostatin B 6-hydroxylase